MIVFEANYIESTTCYTQHQIFPITLVVFMQRTANHLEASLVHVTPNLTKIILTLPFSPPPPSVYLTKQPAVQAPEELLLEGLEGH